MLLVRSAGEAKEGSEFYLASHSERASEGGWLDDLCQSTSRQRCGACRQQPQECGAAVIVLTIILMADKDDADEGS